MLMVQRMKIIHPKTKDFIWDLLNYVDEVNPKTGDRIPRSTVEKKLFSGYSQAQKALKDNLEIGIESKPEEGGIPGPIEWVKFEEGYKPPEGKAIALNAVRYAPYEIEFSEKAREAIKAMYESRDELMIIPEELLEEFKKECQI